MSDEYHLSIPSEDMADSSELVMGDTAWLVEWPQSFDNAGQWPLRWWHCVDGWMLDADRATRFSRKEDAVAYLSAHNMKWAKAVAHEWIGGLCNSCGGTGECSHPEGGPQYQCQDCNPII